LAATVYEGMFILDSNRYAREGVAVADEVNRTIEKFGGKLLVSRLWDDRRLAYPIGSHKKGCYWLTYFSIDSLSIPLLTNELRLNETVLRKLFIKIDGRLVETLVEHAKSDTTPAPEARPGARSDVGTDLARAAKPAAAAVAVADDDEEMGDGESEDAEEDDKD
jgi:small subunit ribosomal protein S6